MADKNILWVEKYRPKTIDKFAFYNSHQRDSIFNILKTRELPHLLFTGIQGTGKTTLAKILINELQINNYDVLVINGSDETSVQVVRDKIYSFISTFPLGDYKVVLLEEAGFISQNGQAALRHMMEEFSMYSRFILTENYENKIIPPIKSRCQHYKFTSPDIGDVTELVATILVDEGVDFNITTLEKYIRVGYPDVRKIINLLQQNTIAKSLRDSSNVSGATDYKFQLFEMVETGNWKGARTLLCNKISNDEWENVYTFLYHNMDKCNEFSDQQKDSAIVVIADYLYKHAFVADVNINGAAMFIQLQRL